MKPEDISLKDEQKYLSKHLVLSTYVYFHSRYNAIYNEDGKINKMLTSIYLKKTNKRHWKKFVCECMKDQNEK